MELLEPDTIARLLEPWVEPDDVEIVRAAVYSSTPSWPSSGGTAGCCLAGDAAHQMPPFLGQGMCTGIRDAANLAWKLELVLAASRRDALLDTYQEERAPHVRAIIEPAVALGGMLQTTDPEVAAARDAAMLGPDAAPPDQTDIGGLTAGVVVAGGGGRVVDGGQGFELRVPEQPALPGELASWWDAVGGRTVVRSDDHVRRARPTRRLLLRRGRRPGRPPRRAPRHPALTAAAAARMEG